MVLSKLHRFIFIKGSKVGGTSVEIALSRFCGPDDIVTPITPIDELTRLEPGAGARNYATDRATELAYLEKLRSASLPELGTIRPPPAPYYNHMPLREVLRLQGPDAHDYQVVCLERNPFAKIFSWANHQLSFDAYRRGGEMRSDWQQLKEFISSAIDDLRILRVRNIDRYRNSHGAVTAHVMRYEQLDNDFQIFMRQRQIKYCEPLPHVKKGILANSLDPRDLLTPQQIARINDLFGEEFERFSYDPL